MPWCRESKHREILNRWGEGTNKNRESRFFQSFFDQEAMFQYL